MKNHIAAALLVASMAILPAIASAESFPIVGSPDDPPINAGNLLNAQPSSNGAQQATAVELDRYAPVSAALSAENTISLLGSAVSSFPIVGSPEDTPLNGANLLHVAFVNDGAKPATAVEFEVDTFGAPVAVVEATGTFTQHAKVEKTFVNAGDAESTVAVIGVRYADGSSWSAYGRPHFVNRRQAAAASGPVIPGSFSNSN